MKRLDGVPVRVVRPRDFLVVADQAENSGLAPLIQDSDPQLLRDLMGKRYHDPIKGGQGWEPHQLWKTYGTESTDSMHNGELQRGVCHRLVDIIRALDPIEGDNAGNSKPLRVCGNSRTPG